jgi:hypothetical protein
MVLVYCAFNSGISGSGDICHECQQAKLVINIFNNMTNRKTIFRKGFSAMIVPILIAAVCLIVVLIIVGPRIVDSWNALWYGAKLPGGNNDVENQYNMIRYYAGSQGYGECVDLASWFITEYPDKDQVNEVYYMKFYCYAAQHKFKELKTLVQDYKQNKKFSTAYTSIKDRKSILLFDYFVTGDKDKLKTLFAMADSIEGFVKYTSFDPLEWPGLGDDKTKYYPNQMNPFFIDWYYYLDSTNCDKTLRKEYDDSIAAETNMNLMSNDDPMAADYTSISICG